jgi:hypothetical protein
MSSIKVTNLQAPSAASPAIVLASDGSATAQLSSLNGGALAGMRNRIINGSFDFWQRGTNTGTWVAPILNYYFSDRWVFNSNGTGGAGSVSQQSFTVGQTAVPGEPASFMRWQITSAASGQASGSCYVEQRIEDVRTFAGQTATLSFYAQGTGTLPNIYVTQTFGTGGSSQVVSTLATSVALNATWTKYTYTVSLPSISGKTIGTNHYVGVTFMVPLNSTYTFDLAQVQLEAGSVATPFERRSYGQELALCQRYYQKSYDQATVPGTNTDTGVIAHLCGTNGTAAFYNTVQFGVLMRAAPSITVYDIAGNSGKVYRAANNKTAATLYVSNKNVTIGTDDATSALGIYYHYTASAEL